MPSPMFQDDGGSDSEEEQEKLNEYESVLKENDPNFGNESEQVAVVVMKRFIHGDDSVDK
jgi:hypothetical protein